MAAEIFNDLPRATNANGVPVDGAQWFFYATGTTTPQAVYSDAELTTSLGAVVSADSGGQFVPVYFDATKTYRGVLKTPSGSTLRDIDPVNAGALSALSSAIGAGLIGVSTTEDYPTNTVGSSLNRFFSFTNQTFELIDLGASLPANGVYMGAAGNSLSHQNLISNPTGGADTDNQRATMLLVARTSDDGNSQEQTLKVVTKIETGYASAWAASTAYAVGANIKNVATNNVYRCTTAGTSAASGTGPSGKGTGIVDGTAVWTWINDDAIRAKCGIYNEVEAVAGAGRSWAQANNLQLQPGYNDDFATSTEIDLKNNSGADSELGGLNRYGLYLAVFGANRSTAAQEITTTNTGSDPYAAFWGLIFAGGKLAERSVLQIDTSSQVGIGFGDGAGAGGVTSVAFSNAAIVDSSTSPKGLAVTGPKSSSGVEVTSTTPASFVSSGTKSFAGFFDNSTAPVGLRLDGTYANDIISSPNFKVTSTGNIIAKPAPTATPANNGEMTFELTSNTQLRIRVKGSDGTVRSASLTLS